MKFNRILRENLEMGDLKRLVNTSLHIDEYKSKMGDDADVSVLSFKVTGKEAGADMVGFIEKGFDFVLDADVSSGEKEGGDYLIFVELQRTEKLPEQIMTMMNDIMNLTEQEITDWTFKYYRNPDEYELTEEVLASTVSLTSEDYNKRYKRDQEEIDQLKTSAGVEVTTTAPVNEFTESLRIAAGLK
jgi:hypothetical protein